MGELGIRNVLLDDAADPGVRAGPSWLLAVLEDPKRE
jgi:hypothetical protein